MNVYVLFHADLFQLFNKYDRVKIQLAFCLNHRKLIYLLNILHIPMVKTMYKTNKHLVL